MEYDISSLLNKLFLTCSKEYTHFSCSTFLTASLVVFSSMNSLKVRLVSSFLTTELPRGCGKSVLNITLSSGKIPSLDVLQMFFIVKEYHSLQCVLQ